MWVHPYQARVSTIDEAAKQLAQLASTGPNWPYALVQLNRDAHQMPLHTEGHLSVMMEGNTSNVPCRKICQLEVCQLLSSGSWVVYPEGLNGCQVPVIMSVPELLSNGVTMLKGESTFLQVDLSQSVTKEQESKAPSLGGGLSPNKAASTTRALSPKAEGQITMTMEVSKLLSQAVLDNSGLASRSSTPKRPGPLLLATPLPLKPEDSAKPVDTFSQVSIPDDAEMDDPTLEEINASPSHPVETPGTSGEAPSLDITQLQEEANKALGHLLAIRSAINTHQRKEVSDFGMAPLPEWVWGHLGHQGSKGPLCLDHQGCGGPPCSANKWSQSLACCLYQGGWGQLCLHLSRGREPLLNRYQGGRVPWCFPGSLNSRMICQRHSVSRGRGHWRGEKGLPHLPYCLQYCPQGQPSWGPWNNSYPLPATARKCSYVYPAKHSPRGITPSTRTCPTDSPYLCPSSAQALTLIQAAAQLAQLGGASVPIGDHLQSDYWRTPHSKWKEETLFHKALMRSCQDAFSRDFKLVWKVREDYYWENHPHFDSKTSYDLEDVFQSMIESASLLSCKIYKIKETWTGWSELQYFNYTLRTLPKGLKFFHPLSPSESPKVWA